MNANPYAPPTAMVADVLPQEEVRVEPPFFAVGLPKLAVMSLCTLNLYQLYWFYKHWKRIGARERTISPAARTIFTFVFAYSCFARIRDYDGSQDGTLSLLGSSGIDLSGEPPRVGWTLYPAPLAIGWILITLLNRLPEPYYMLSFLSFVLLLPVQAYANALNAIVAPSHDRNSRLTRWNWVIVVVGGLTFALAIIGLLLPEP